MVFFESVDIKTQPGPGGDTLDVVISVVEKSTGTFQIGAGFSSIQSFIATAQISQNNFLGTGQTLSLSAHLSFGDFARQYATFYFVEPYLFDSNWYFSFNAYLQYQRYTTSSFMKYSRGISPSIGYPITRKLRVNFGYTLEDIEITTDVSPSDPGPAYYNLDNEGINSAMSLTLSYDARDNRLFPNKGMFHSFTAEISDPVLGA
ncbi:MAG TPA: outer membrane protein assembly factor BamA, partial [Flavobacteriales bacterium]|nr:outer membrane protein assembly factor BamA [Flavobacteriales bacterium]